MVKASAGASGSGISKPSSLVGARSLVSPKPGTSNAKKPRFDDDIPSDDSEAGGNLTASKQRIRKPRIAFTRPLSRLTPQRSLSVEIPNGNLYSRGLPSRAESCFFNMTGAKERIKRLGLPPRNGLSSTTSSTSTNKLRPIHVRTNQRKLSLISEQLAGTPESSPNLLVTQRNVHHEGLSSGITGRIRKDYAYSESGGWTFYSVWHPAWDVIWKCHDPKALLIKSIDFQSLLLEIFNMNTFSELQHLHNLKVLRMEEITSADDNCDIKGKVETVINSSKWKAKRASWKPSRIVGRLLSVLGSSGDILVQCTQKNSSPHFGSPPVTFFHVTAKDGTKIDFNSILKSQHIDLTSCSYRLTYDRFALKAVKFCPLQGQAANHPLLWQRRQAIVHNSTGVSTHPSQDAAAPLSQNIDEGTRSNLVVVYPDDGTNNQSSSNINTPMDIPVLPPLRHTDTLSPLHEKSNDNLLHQANDQAEKVAEVVRNDVIPSDNDDICEIESVISSSDKEENMQVHAVPTVAFLPGPLRPKLKKAEGGKYVYHKLAKLSQMLNKSIADDVTHNGVSNHTIKHECHVYGIVDEVVQQDKHQNAYHVRISDETLSSVLLRLHMSTNERVPGPSLVVGSVIRVHRLRVQVEWDPGVGDNCMVLSTCFHHNYVLFTYSGEKEIYYETSAKSITLDDFDKKRVQELFRHKSEHPARTGNDPSDVACDNIDNVEVQSDTHNGSIADLVENDAASEGICQSDIVENDTASEGICQSDIASQPTILGSMEDNLDSAVIQFLDDAEMNCSEDKINGRSCIEKPQEILQNCRSLQITLFKDLSPSKSPVNLLCQVIGLKGPKAGRRQVWQLILRDVTRSVAPDVFAKINVEPGLNDLTDDDNLRIDDSCLFLCIINPIVFECRDVFGKVMNALGSGELYYIPNVHVTGKQPPYRLEADGGTFLFEKNSLREMSTDLQLSSTTQAPLTNNETVVPDKGEPSRSTVGNPSVLTTSGLKEPDPKITEEPIQSEAATGLDSSLSSREANDRNNNAVPDEEVNNEINQPEHAASNSSTKRGKSGLVESVSHEDPSQRVLRKRPHESSEESVAQTTYPIKRRNKRRQHYQSEEALNC